MSPPETTAQAGSVPQNPITITPMSLQQEDNIIHTRITNDEKALRRVTKKFHGYTSVAYDTAAAPSPLALPAPSVDDARDAFLIELASFHLSLKKSLMVCEAEARQVEEYQREKERIENEHVRLKDQIEELKHSLEQAQLHRKRKQEYDIIAEKINVLPSRDELEQLISSLENDMAVIRTEQEDQDRVLLGQQAALADIVRSIQGARTLGKHEQDAPDDAGTPAPAPDAEAADVEMGSPGPEETGEIREDRPGAASGAAEHGGERERERERERETDGEHDRDSDDDVPLAIAKKLLNPAARAFAPASTAQSRIATPQLASSAPTPGAAREEGEADDIEMGELAEEPEEKAAAVAGSGGGGGGGGSGISGSKQRKVREDLEEGEASDMSSELSEIPSDTEL